MKLKMSEGLTLLVSVWGCVFLPLRGDQEHERLSQCRLPLLSFFYVRVQKQVLSDEARCPAMRLSGGVVV
ncbi:hypothetical protein E2C01_055648 [Portunus trituberculatus]|uniref:Secreted protein n=1 Tax=Portunus trituberculatus TaxID=210409 RepID=A0A5B7GY96_PORTR|nr:hypothetical protein [Portunus trituberculatus]